MEMSRLTRDGTAEPVSRDQILRHAWAQGNIHFSCSADHEQGWQPYPVDHTLLYVTTIHTYICYYHEEVLSFLPNHFDIFPSCQVWMRSYFSFNIVMHHHLIIIPSKGAMH